MTPRGAASPHAVHLRYSRYALPPSLAAAVERCVAGVNPIELTGELLLLRGRVQELLDRGDGAAWPELLASLALIRQTAEAEHRRALASQGYLAASTALALAAVIVEETRNLVPASRHALLASRLAARLGRPVDGIAVPVDVTPPKERT